MDGLSLFGVDRIGRAVIGVVRDPKPIMSKLSSAAKHASNVAAKLHSVNPRAAQKLQALSQAATSKGSALQKAAAKVASAAKMAAKPTAKPVAVLPAVVSPIQIQTVLPNIEAPSVQIQTALPGRSYSPTVPDAIRTTQTVAPTITPASLPVVQTVQPTKLPVLSRPVTTTVSRPPLQLVKSRVGQVTELSASAFALEQQYNAMADVYDAFAAQVDDAGVAGEVIALVQPLLTQLQGTSQTALVNTGNNLVIQANAVIANVDVNAPSGGVSQAGNDLMNQAEAWVEEARKAITAASTTSSTTVAVTAPTSPSTPPPPGAPPVLVQGAQWMPNTAYAAGSTVINNGNTYAAQTAGTSGATPGPQSMQTPLYDGTVQWAFSGSQQPQQQGGGYGGGGSSGGGGGDDGGGGADDGSGDAGGGDVAPLDDGSGGDGSALSVLAARRTAQGSGDGDESADGGGSDDAGGGGSDAPPDLNNPGFLIDGSPDPTYGAGGSSVGGLDFFGHGGGHGGHGGGHGRGGFRGPGLWGGGPWPYLYDDGLELLDASPVDDDAIDAVVEAVAKRIKEKQAIVGAFNMQTERDKMNALKVVTISIAELLLKAGQQAIDAARVYASLNDLPGGTARDKVYFNLKWYADDIAKVKSAAKSPNDLYASGADLKERVLNAFVEWNAAEEGAAALAAMWSAMWVEIGAKLAALPRNVIDAAEKAAGTVAWYSKIVFWVGLAAAVGLTGAVGYGVYRKVSA